MSEKVSKCAAWWLLELAHPTGSVSFAVAEVPFGRVAGRHSLSGGRLRDKLSSNLVLHCTDIRRDGDRAARKIRLTAAETAEKCLHDSVAGMRGRSEVAGDGFHALSWVLTSSIGPVF